MRRNSPQGLCGRRGCGNGGAATRAKKGEVGSVWEVVLSLASALTEARDQLVTLINNSSAGGAATRMSGGCGRHLPPARSCNSPYPGAGTWVRNVHRGHAHGHVAFGCSSEYRLHSSPVRVKQPRPLFHVQVSPPPERTPRPCLHPLHKMHVLPRSSSSPWPPRARSPGSSEARRRPASCNPNAVHHRRNLSPDQRRHCIGTQYAALLREESYQLRERRMHPRGRTLPWGPR